jgi:hypothetical protein
MRKLFLITSVLIAATSAHATQTRGLLTPSSGTQTAQLQVEDQKPSVVDQLKAIGEVPKPAVSEQVVAPVPAPVPAPVAQTQAAAAPVATTPASAAAVAPASADARAQAEPAKKPAKKSKVQRRETDEQKARRIAARYGVSW